ncbi:MAG: exodeoxyribonuclease VII small subunit [Oscillospiraceae bacterium]|nr:exodeoxyribonuclease VII small subunit [Oscillospiraceae bacterium]
MTFEENLSALSEITKKLEEGTLTLEESVELYQKGLTLSAECKKQLQNAKLRIKENPEEEAKA